jgi:hypothetical protein
MNVCKTCISYTNGSIVSAAITGKLRHIPFPQKKAIRLEIELLADNGGEALAGAVYLYVPKDSIYYAVLPGDHILFTAPTE